MRPAYVVIDPKGELVDRLARLKIFSAYGGSLANNLVIIDPTHATPPALGMFKAPRGKQSPEFIDQLIEDFGYIFSGSDARLTQRQSIPFSYVVRLVFHMGGDLNTLMDILEDTPDLKKGQQSRFANEIASLSKVHDGARRFFQNDFYSTAFSPTKEQIKVRLHEIISRPNLMKVLNARENTLNLVDSFERGDIVLVNTARTMLRTKASTLLGRYIISLSLSAAYVHYRRFGQACRPVFLVIDEFQDFADEDFTPQLLRLAREYRMGVVIAHQAMHATEITQSIRNAISINTSIKYAASPEGEDANYMANNMRCDADFLRTMQPNHKDRTISFACYVRGMSLTHPFKVTFPYPNITPHMQMPQNEYDYMLRCNAETFGARTYDEYDTSITDKELSDSGYGKPPIVPLHIWQSWDTETQKDCSELWLRDENFCLTDWITEEEAHDLAWADHLPDASQQKTLQPKAPAQSHKPQPGEPIEGSKPHADKW